MLGPLGVSEDRIVKKVFNENVGILEEGGRIHFAYMAMSGEFVILKKCGAKRLSGLRLFIRETSSARWRCCGARTPPPRRRPREPCERGAGPRRHDPHGCRVSSVRAARAGRAGRAKRDFLK